MHLSLGSHAKETQQQKEAREAKQVFKDNIRADWQYVTPHPAVLQRAQAYNDAIAGFKIHEDAAPGLLEQVRPSVIGWCERVYASSDSEYFDEEDGQQEVKHGKKEMSSEYLFEGPDSVGDEVAHRKSARSHKREVMLAREMEWNIGLKHFIERREAWTGSRSKVQVQIEQTRMNTQQTMLRNSEASSPRSSSSSSHADGSTRSRPSTAATSPGPVTSAAVSTTSRLDMLIPKMSRLLMANSIRKKIGPSMYGEIYSKIIVQSRTPSVPINLLDLTRALVQGWKMDGEWPPQPNPPEPSIVRKRASLKKAVTKVLKITTGEAGLASKEGAG